MPSLLDDAGRRAEALHAARKAVALGSESARLLVNLGTRLLDDDRPHEAIPYLEKAVRVQPEWPEPIGVLGIARFRAKQFAAAAECLETALRKDPEVDPWAWAYLGVSLEETGRPQGAVHALETAVFMKPDYGWAWARLGKALRALGRHAEAVAAYEKAIGNSFAPSVVWWDMGLSAAEVPDLAQLERACQGLRKLDAAAARKLRRKLRSLRGDTQTPGRGRTAADTQTGAGTAGGAETTDGAGTECGAETQGGVEAAASIDSPVMGATGQDPPHSREGASATRRDHVAGRGELVPERAS